MANFTRSSGTSSNIKDGAKDIRFTVGDLKLGEGETAYVVMKDGVLKQLANQSEIEAINTNYTALEERVAKLENPTG
ncbi:hypothetical protein WP2_18 [Lactococcus phage WP-2]|uniref:Uncharacterized protein n=1 Tax=Lactococcus phage WP-2 TaxID=1486423 RepID=A0A024B369_9CAUD|nr:hypothetical protein WP2_18 [Lactococcus phage WP-2]AHZ10890.1 hypothetical protein WP2_18 [Lactococcus phage WP-2]